MDHIKGMAGQVEWAAGNIAYNLDFIPAEKLNWKPAPTAPSALEIVQHAVGVFARVTPLLRGGGMGEVDDTPLASLDEAKQRLISGAHEYAEAMRALKPEDLGRKVPMHFGPMSLAFVASMPVTDLIHHHGQIAYIQMLLGDTESHFDTTLLPQP